MPVSSAASTPAKLSYFPGLDSLRCFAAFAVVFGHLEIFLHHKSLDNFAWYVAFWKMGDQGVRFFFVLSGFLITHVLLNDPTPTGQGRLTNFYMRRILRIWPCYYLTLFVGLVLLRPFPELAWSGAFDLFNTHTVSITLLYLLLLPNAVFHFFGVMPYVGATWSIGVEEQFYAFWPLLFCGSKSKVWWIAAFTVFFWCYPSSTLNLNSVAHFFLLQPFHFLTLGALFAHLYRTPKLLRFLSRPACEIVSYSLILLFVFYPYELQLPRQVLDLSGILYGIVIVNVALNPNALFKWDWKITKALGRISYGIYMYHSAAFALALWLSNKLFAESSLHSLSIHGLSYLLPVVVAFLSYRFVERPFLKLKDRFSYSPPLQINRYVSHG